MLEPGKRGSTMLKRSVVTDRNDDEMWDEAKELLRKAALLDLDRKKMAVDKETMKAQKLLLRNLVTSPLAGTGFQAMRPSNIQVEEAERMDKFFMAEVTVLEGIVDEKTKEFANLGGEAATLGRSAVAKAAKEGQEALKKAQDPLDYWLDKFYDILMGHKKVVKAHKAWDEYFGEFMV